MSAWIKVESLDRWYSSIILTDGFEEGEPHWQITGEGKLILQRTLNPEEIKAHYLAGKPTG
ncbi:MAG: hypothetical protein ACPGFB_15560 [Verrucomicrobiales bacterium]